MIWEENTYLMLDVGLVEQEENTSFVREEAFKYESNPIATVEDKALTLGGLAKSFGFFTVMHDGGVYRAWYEARGVRESLGAAHKPGQEAAASANEEFCKSSHIAYAESADGIHFRPVRVGQVEINGSKDNNLIHFPGPDEGRHRVFSIFHDPLDSEYPYKCVYYRPGSRADFSPGVVARYPQHGTRDWWYVWGIGKSKDGLVWERPAHEHNLISTNPEHAHLHRALDGGLVISDQMMSAMADWAYRGVKGWITYDLETAHRIPDYLFQVPEHVARVFNEFMGTTLDRTPWVQPHVGLQCARKGPTMVGLNGYLYCCNGAETFAQTTAIGLCVSDTGVRFREVWPLIPFVPRGPRGAWDFGMVAQTSLLDCGDETRIYYTGGLGNLSRKYEPGFAYIPRDRYGYRLIRGYRDMDVKPRTGSFTMKPCVLPARPAIALNVAQTTATRTARVALRDENGGPLPGYGAADCVPIAEPGLRQPVRWQGGRSAAELAGRRVKIHVDMTSPDCGRVEYDSPRVYAIYTG